MDRETFHQTRWLRTPSNLALSTSMDGASTTPPDYEVYKKTKYFTDKLRESFYDSGMCGRLLQREFAFGFGCSNVHLCLVSQYFCQGKRALLNVLSYNWVWFMNKAVCIYVCLYYICVYIIFVYKSSDMCCEVFSN